MADRCWLQQSERKPPSYCEDEFHYWALVVHWAAAVTADLPLVSLEGGAYCAPSPLTTPPLHGGTPPHTLGILVRGTQNIFDLLMVFNS